MHLQSAKNTLYSLRKLSIYTVSFFLFCSLTCLTLYFYSESEIIKAFMLTSSILGIFVLIIDCVPSYHKIKAIDITILNQQIPKADLSHIKTPSKKIQILSFVPVVSITLLIIAFSFDWVNLLGVLLAISLISGIFLAFELIQNYLLDIFCHEVEREVKKQ